MRLRVELPELREAIKATDKRARAALIVLDEHGIGLGVLQFLQRKGYRKVEATRKTSEPLERDGPPARRPNLSKIERFGRAAQYIGKGLVFIPTQAAWLDAFLYEITSFPNIADKDQVDSMSQLVGYLDAAIHRARYYKACGFVHQP